MPFSPLSRIVVVTGGSRGIGIAVAEKFLSENCHVVLISKNKSNLNQAASHLSERANGGSVSSVPCDVRNEADVQKCFMEISSKFNKIDTLINSAGISFNKLLIQSNKESIENVISTNLLGSIYTCQAALKLMIKQKSGSIVNIGSVVGAKGNAGQSVYSASKSGLVGFTRSLAKEVGSRNIRVNLIVPGAIKTEMTDEVNVEPFIKQTCLGRLGLPHEVADATYFLSQATYITGAVGFKRRWRNIIATVIAVIVIAMKKSMQLDQVLHHFKDIRVN